MIEFNKKVLTDDEDELEDDLDWLMEASEENSNDEALTSNLQEKISLNNSVNLTNNFTTDGNSSDETDDDIDDGLNEEERALLQLNTAMNDAADCDSYDVKQRIEKANQELAAEKHPLDDEERERKVGFKAKLIEHMPSIDNPLSSLSSSEDGNNTDNENNTSEKDLTNKMNELQLQVDDSANFSNEVVEYKNSLIVEKGGKFEYVDEDEMTSQSFETKPKLTKQVLDSNITTSTKSRPKSAPVKSVRKSPPARPMSAANLEYERQKMPTKTFTYSEETKRRIKEKAELKAKEEAEECKRQKEQERIAREEANDIWRSWVEKKNEELKIKKKEEQEYARRQEELSKRNNVEAEEAFQAWLKQKAIQARRDRILLQQQQLELEEGLYIRERRECDRAFRSWLRKKNEMTRKKKQEENRLRKMTSRQLKKTRKAQQVMDSLREAQQLKYVNYYGYRV